jgi:hypothetical protein
MTDDAFKASWRRQFALALHPQSPMLQTLVEAAAKLDAARGYLETLSQDVDAEREHGLFVAELAARYALAVLEHFGMVDGPDPPMPINLTQARQAVGNLLTTVREYVELGQHAAADSSGDDEAENAAASPSDDGDATAVAASATDYNKFVVDPATFSVKYKGKECPLGNTKEFQVIERLGRSRGTYLKIATLMTDVWGDTIIDRTTVQKTISNVRKKLIAAGLGELVVIDGTQRDSYTLKFH